MRTEELKIVSTAQIATVVHKNIAQGKLLHLNLDETTLAQKEARWCSDQQHGFSN